MKNIIIIQNKRTEISLEDFHKNMVTGNIGHNLSDSSANSYIAHIKMLIRTYRISPKEFLEFTFEDFLALLELVNDDQKNNQTYKDNTYNATLSALQCYRHYLDLKYNGVIRFGRRTRVVRTRVKANPKTKNKSWFSRFLQFLGLGCHSNRGR